MVTVCFHELAHAIAFKIQKIDIRMIAIFPICLVKEKAGLRFHVAVSMETGFGGIVIPKMPIISNQTDYESFRNKMRVSLMCAPLFSAFIGTISLVLVLCTTKYISNDFCSDYFLFFSALFIWAVYINFTSMLDLGSIIGDYSATRKMKSNNVYSLLQIYNYFLLQDSESKFVMREEQRYFIEKLNEAANNLSMDKESKSINVLLMNAVFYESLMRQSENNFDRTDFNTEVWEKYKDKMPSTVVGKYNCKQVELLLYGKNIEELKNNENIKISSMDSLLSKINNYYDDEIYLNNLIISTIE